jgi:hypothetical protein
MTLKTHHASSPSRRASGLALFVALLSVSCGGGGGGGGDSGGGGGVVVPPPVSEPPVFSTPTAVRVSGPTTPFTNGCLPLPAGAVAYVDAEVEPHLAINPSNPNHLVAAWQQDRLSDGGARGLVTAVSVDGGGTWSPPQSAPFSQCAGGAFARASDPWVAVNGTTAFHISIAFTGAASAVGSRSAILVSKSIDGGNTWGVAVPLIDDDGTRFFNDKESLTIDSNDPRYVYAVWDRLDPTERGVTLLARSTDGGISWSQAAPIYDPGAGRQTIGNVAVTTPNGAVHVFFTELGPSASNPAVTEGALKVIRSNDKGVTWSAPSLIAQLPTFGTRVPGQTNLQVRAGEILGTFAANPVDGTLYAAWQDSRFTGGQRDSIALASSTDGGATWSAPVRANADAAAPAFTPTLAVLAGGVVGVTYYDFRLAGTTTFRPTDLWLAVTRDGITWRETRLAGDFDLLDAPNAGGLFIGDYHGLVGTGSTMISLYSRTNTGNTANRTDVFLDRVNAEALVSGAVPATSTTRKTTPLPAWSQAAAERVDENLTRIRARRSAKWHAWREAEPEPSLK